MSYIGSSASPIPVHFASVTSQSFSGNGITLQFTMNREVANVSSIEVLVNNVQQSPFDSSYSVSGTTLTFSEAPSVGSNNIYIIYRDQALGSIRDETAVSKSGDTITGSLSVSGTVEASSYTQGGAPLEAGAKKSIFWENEKVLTENYTITESRNAGSFGPIYIDDGVSVTIPSGSRWVII